MQRYLHHELIQHFSDSRQMIFLSGPRQVGKTTIASMIGESMDSFQYLNWDNISNRKIILEGVDSIAEKLRLNQLGSDNRFCIFDELHKFKDWRDFLKGFFDEYESKVKVLVTGSASLQTFRRGGDSLMGRYFPYTLHPISVAECVNRTPLSLINHEPKLIDEDQWINLWRYGGFPEPFLKGSDRFHNRWRSQIFELLVREDIRDLTRIQDLSQIEMLAEYLRYQVGQLTSYTYLAKSVRVSIDTVRRWISTLEAFYYSFTIKPWHTNIPRSLRKEPKYYLWDWSQVDNRAARFENLVASSLLKAVNFWTQSGLSHHDLYFIRDKQKREVDFLVTKNNKPWILIEAKLSSQAKLSKNLVRFQELTKAKYAFQVALDLDFVERDCFEFETPIIVPAKTFLSQLV